MSLLCCYSYVYISTRNVEKITTRVCQCKLMAIILYYTEKKSIFAASRLPSAIHEGTIAKGTRDKEMLTLIPKLEPERILMMSYA